MGDLERRKEEVEKNGEVRRVAGMRRALLVVLRSIEEEGKESRKVEDEKSESKACRLSLRSKLTGITCKLHNDRYEEIQ